MTKRDLCPLCSKPTAAIHAPFCSQACRDRDLLNWLGEGYRLPGAAIDPDDAANAQSGLDSTSERD